MHYITALTDNSLSKNNLLMAKLTSKCVFNITGMFTCLSCSESKTDLLSVGYTAIKNI